MKEISSHKKTFDNELQSATSLQDLENLRIKYLGRNGIINSLLQNIKNTPEEKRKEYGQQVNELKSTIESALSAKQSDLSKEKSEVSFDTSLPGKKPQVGHL